MSANEIDFYTHVKVNGDRKILYLCRCLGRVHHFGQELAAYRHVIDEGDSYSARRKRKTKWRLYCFYTRQKMESYRLIEHLFGIKYYNKYFYIIFKEIISYKKFHKSVMKEVNYYPSNIPWYIWPCLPFYAAYELARRTVKILLNAIGINTK